MNGETAENVDAVKYLGDIFNSKGGNNDLIESRVETEKQKIGIIQSICKEIALGNYEIQIMNATVTWIYILEHCALQLSIMDKLNKHICDHHISHPTKELC